MSSTVLKLFINFCLIGYGFALGGRGSKSALNLIAARSSDQHALHATEPITIWCSPDNPQVLIKSAHFSKNNQKYEGVLDASKKNATYTFESPSVNDAGEYKCELDTPHGKITHKAYIYARPVVHSNEHFTAKDGHEYHLEGSGTTIAKGESVNLTCPVTGYPKPGVKWTKDGAPLALSKSVSMIGTTIVISSANYTDAGTYSCEAINEYNANQKTSKMLLVVDKMLNVQSEYQWIYPLATIIIILLLLVLIIIACEFRNKKQNASNKN